MRLPDLIKNARDGAAFGHAELVQMLSYREDSPESYQIMAEANRIAKELTDNQAEVHAQFALNLAPCPCDCAFCSFAKVNGIFTEEVELTPEQAVAYAKQFEEDGANAIFVMITANYGFSRFIEVSQEIRSNLRADTILIANVGDQSLENAKSIKDAGYTGVYHAVRLREGTDTSLSPAKRLESIKHFKEAGLKVGTCVEPIGPEHTNEELADTILLTGSFNPAYSGAGRRIAIPGTAFAERGMISELRMAQIVAVTRLGVPRTVLGNCTHEPCTLGAIGGANLFWAEVGANPRDVEEKTEESRGETVPECGQIFHEAGWNVWKGPSRYYGESG